VLPLSISNICSFPEGHPVASYIFFLYFPPLMSFPPLSFNNVLWKQVPTQDMINPVSLPSFYRLWDIPVLPDSALYFIFHTVRPTDFGIILQHISEISGLFVLLSKCLSFSALRVMLQMQHYINLFLKIKLILVVKKFFFLLNTALVIAILGII
jgi:hypothetical protein